MNFVRNLTRCLLLVLAVNIVLISAVIYVVRKQYLYEQNLYLEQKHERLEVLRNSLVSDFDTIISDTRIYANLLEVGIYLEDPTPSKRIKVQQNFKEIIRQKRSYTQVRLLNLFGKEMIRINMDQGIVEEEDLQDKSDRSYFLASERLDEGDVYISGIELNIEYGRVQYPYQPVIRFSTPVHASNGRPLAYLVINYRADALLSKVEALYMGESNEVTILNEEGYRLASADKEKNWAFMFDEKKNHTWRLENPTLWNEISSKSSGEMLSGDVNIWTTFDLRNVPVIGNDIVSEKGKLYLVQTIDGLKWKSQFDGILGSLINFIILMIISSVLFLLYRAFRLRFRSQLEKQDFLNQEILDSAGVAVIATEPDGLISTYNKAAEKLLGWERNEIVGKFTPDIFHIKEETLERAAHLSSTLGRPVEIGFELFAEYARISPAEAMEWTYRRKDGQRIPVLLALNELRDDEGNLMGYLGVATDIRTRKEMERVLVEARDEAERSAQMKSHFLANMSHEIRTPMNGIIGMIGLLMTTDLEPDQYSYAKTVQHSADALLNVLNDILDFSKIEAGKIHFDAVPFDIVETLENALSLFRELSQSKGLELLLDINPRMHRTYEGDPSRISQVVMNLLGNAIKFTERGEVVLRVRELVEGPERRQIRIEVEDTGIGIADKSQKNLFQPFVQADGTTTRNYGGTGLGLAICKELVELMGGTIGMKSEEDVGSTFHFEIALKALQDNVESLEKTISSRGAKVLTLDDNTTNLEILKLQLSSLEMEVIQFQKGSDALEYIRQKGRDLKLIITDFQMPEMDGIQFMEQVRLIDGPQSQIPAILLSSTGDTFDTQTLLRTRIGSTLIKPPRYAEFMLSIQNAIVGGSVPRFQHELEKESKKKILSKTGKFNGVIIAEDNLINQRVATLQLRQLGYEAVCFENGEEVLQNVIDGMARIILMDCQMPVMDGYVATREIRKWEKKNGIKVPVYIIAMTAHAMEADREKCLEAGMNDYITKPVKSDSLQQAMERAREFFAEE